MATLGIDGGAWKARIGSGLDRLGDAIVRRARLLRGRAPPPPHAHVPPMKLFLANLDAFVDPIARRFRRPLRIAQAAVPKVVILLPGFGTGPRRMRYMARQLERAGHTVKRWGMGTNLGPTEENFALLGARVCAVRERYGQPVVLVGWSLGGIFAREVAKLHPDCVSKVVTMGTPFSHTPYSNNIWRTYEMVAGHSVEAPPVATELTVKPPVETVAIWSPRDGVISHRSACGCPGERDRTVAVRCTHLGFPTAPDCIMAVARELDA